MGVRENKVEKYLDEKIKAIGGITRKWVSPGRDGVPDRVVLVPMTCAQLVAWYEENYAPGDTVALVTLTEVKVTDGDKSGPQEREQVRLRDAGANVNTVYGEGGVDALLGALEPFSSVSINGDLK